MKSLILALNCGSSSIKFALFETDGAAPPRKPWWAGKIDGITGAEPTATVEGHRASVVLDGHDPYRAALRYIRTRIEAKLATGRHRIAGVAHRVVHGGSRYREATRISKDVLADLRSYIPLAPLHQPFALEAIAILLAEQPDLPQVACFDTGFHRTLPRVEQMLPLPYTMWERGVRRYGFHGLSYEYAAVALAERYGEVARGRTIVAHLGSGASLCAMQGLESVATTMGFSALDGLMMNTRCGSLDPGVVLYLMEVEGLPPDRIAHLLYHDSGLRGVSGSSGDPQALLALEASQPRCRDALALYVRRIVRETGALIAVLGGLDLLAFTAGIGEHNAELRARVCAGLRWLGLNIDDRANAASEPTISTPTSRVLIAVEPTNEEWIAARSALAVIRDLDDRTPRDSGSAVAP